MAIKWEHPSNYRYGGGLQASLATLQDPDDTDVGGGVAGEVSDNLEPFRNRSVVIHATALDAGAAPTSDVVTLEVSNDGTIWFPEIVFTFTAKSVPQEAIFEDIKFRYVRSNIDGSAAGSYLINAFCAQ